MSDVKEKISDVKENVSGVKENVCDVKENVSGAKDFEGLEAMKRRKKDAGCDSMKTEKDKYERHKKYLKDDLIEFYRQRQSRFQMSPLFEEIDTPLAAFYVRPEIEEIKGTKDEKRKVKSLSDMFKFGSKMNREIYLSADAGLGKTTFSKYLATSWCQAHCQEEKESISLEKDDIESMRDFEFVFLVLLRNSYYLCSIEDLIFNSIVSTLARSEKFDKGFLQEILNREKCLVILDGLDEWTHPEIYEKPCYRTPRSIPHRNGGERCTVLTTTRPWKLGVLNLSSNEAGKQVQLTKLSDESSVTLTKRSLQKLKYLSVEDSETEFLKFNEELNERDHTGLAVVPLLLMYIICLWCDGVPIGKSKCELYINIVELLLLRTEAKHGELQLADEHLDGDIPECFTEHEHCTKYFILLMNLGKLAYHTLLDEKRENTLVFDRKVAEEYFEADDMQFCLHSGILTESTTRTLTKKISKVSFSHKTVQEFFAAIFICSQNDAQKTVLEKCKNVQSILDMSVICEFLSKMNSKMMCEISAGFMSVMNEDQETRAYRTRSGGEIIDRNQLYHLQNLLLSCLKEMPENENSQLYCHDLFITRHIEMNLKRLAKLCKNKISSLYIYTGMFPIKLSDIVGLISPEDLNGLEKLHYEGAVEAEINYLLFPSIHSLSLIGKRTNYDKCMRMSGSMEQMQKLQYLDFRDFDFSHDMLTTFVNFISSKTTLKEVILSRLYCDKHRRDCERMKLDFSKHSHLTKVALELLPPLELIITSPSLVDVCLSDMNLGERSVLLSPEMLKITHIDLKHIEMSTLQDNLKILDKLQQKVKVNVEECHLKKFNSVFRNYSSDTERHETIVEFCSQSSKEI